MLCLELALVLPARVALGVPGCSLARESAALARKTDLLMRLVQLFGKGGAPRVPSTLTMPVFSLFDVSQGEYLAAVGKSSIEVIFFPRHLVVRVGDKFVDMSQADGIRIREPKVYTEKKSAAVGFVFPATEAEIRRLKSKFEAAQRKDLKHNYLTQNCSQVLCRGMEDVGLPSPDGALQRLLPELAAEFYSQHGNAAYATVYSWDPSVTPEVMLAKSKKELIKQVMIAGVVTAAIAGAGVGAATALSPSNPSGAGTEEKRPDPDVSGPGANGLLEVR